MCPRIDFSEFLTLIRVFVNTFEGRVQTQKISIAASAIIKNIYKKKSTLDSPFDFRNKPLGLLSERNIFFGNKPMRDNFIFSYKIL